MTSPLEDIMEEIKPTRRSRLDPGGKEDRDLRMHPKL